MDVISMTYTELMYPDLNLNFGSPLTHTNNPDIIHTPHRQP